MVTDVQMPLHISTHCVAVRFPLPPAVAQRIHAFHEEEERKDWQKEKYVCVSRKKTLEDKGKQDRNRTSNKPHNTPHTDSHHVTQQPTQFPTAALLVPVRCVHGMQLEQISLTAHLA